MGAGTLALLLSFLVVAAPQAYLMTGRAQCSAHVSSAYAGASGTHAAGHCRISDAASQDPASPLPVTPSRAPAALPAFLPSQLIIARATEPQPLPVPVRHGTQLSLFILTQSILV